MNAKEFEKTYREMTDEQLLELTTELDQLVPEAKEVLAGELRRRGVTPGDVEKRRGDGEQVPPEAAEPGSEGGEQAEPVYRRKGPAPADWARISAFSIDEAMALAQCLEQARTPWQVMPAPEHGPERFVLAVPADQLKRCAELLKAHFGLTDEPAELYTGDCSACGTKVEKAASCPECELVLSQDVWEYMGRHPFLSFLEQMGLGRKKRA